MTTDNPFNPFPKSVDSPSLRRCLTALLLTLALLAATPPERAEGWLIAPAGSRVQPTALAVLAVWPAGGGTERVVLRVDYRVDGAGVRDFGWVVAVPGEAQVGTTPPELFDQLGAISRPQGKPLDRLRAWYGSFGGPPLPPARPPERPPGFQSTTLAPNARLETTVTAAGDTAALRAWAAAHGYVLPAADPEAVVAAAGAGRRFILVRVIAERGVLIGGATPALQLTFPTGEPVVPTRLMLLGDDGRAAAGRAIPASLWLLGDTRLAVDGGSGSRTADEFAGRLHPMLLAAALGETAPVPTTFLTRVRTELADGAPADLAIRAAADQSEIGVGTMAPDEWAQAALLAVAIPVVWIVNGLARSGTAGTLFGVVAVAAALLPLLRREWRPWWPLVLALIYLALAMPAAREVVQRAEVDLAYLAVAVAVGLVLLALWHARRVNLARRRHTGPHPGPHPAGEGDPPSPAG